MTDTKPLDKIKDVATQTLKAPASVLGSAVGLATSAAGKAAGAVAAVVGGRSTLDPEKPVNVTEELGLDPAPVTKPKRARKGPTTEPVTKIDAEADPAEVRATPADVAEVVSPND